MIKKTVKKRTSNGKFPRGVSGNPKGRPPGRRNRSTELVQALEADIDRQVASLRERALAGDPIALKVYWDRVLPRPAGRLVEFELPELRDFYDYHDALIAVLKEVAGGRLTPAEGHQMADLIERAERSYVRTQEQLTKQLGNVNGLELLQYYRLVAPEEFKKLHEAGLLSGSACVMKMEPPANPDELIERCQYQLDTFDRYLWHERRFPRLGPRQLARIGAQEIELSEKAA